MSFFRDLVAEVQKELDNATSEFKKDLQQSIPGLTINPVAQRHQGGAQTRPGPTNQHAAPLFSSGQHGVNPGVVEHPPNAPTDSSRSVEQRPQPKKRRKKTPQKAAAATQLQMKKTSFVHPHKLVANLTPAVARSSIIMSEVLGPPVSKRQNRRGWHF